MSDSSPTPDRFCFSNGVQKAKSNTFFSVPFLFVGFTTKCLSDCDAVKSPTSLLDCRVFSSLGSSFFGLPRSPRLDAKTKCWDNTRVGLGLVGTLNDENNPCGNVFSESKQSILFVPQKRINISSPKSHLDGIRYESQSVGTAPRSLPKDYGILSDKLQQSGVEKKSLGSKVNDLNCRESSILRSCSVGISRSSLTDSRFMDHCPKSNSKVLKSETEIFFVVDSASSVKEIDNFEESIAISVDSSHELVSFLSANDIEQLEDYTCIISRGPNPKTTRIFGDCILESSGFDSLSLKCKNGTHGERSLWLSNPSEDLPHSSAGDFLSFCFSCNMKLEEGKDIYMFRGEKAFCTCYCLDREMLIEEEMEKSPSNSSDYAHHSMRRYFSTAWLCPRRSVLHTKCQHHQCLNTEFAKINNSVICI